MPCYRLAYEPSVSYATASNYDIDSLLHDTTNVDSIREKYILARNVQQRVTESIVESDESMITQLNESISTVESVMDTLKDQLPMDRIVMEEMFANMQKRLYFHKEKALDNVLYIIENDFIRGWNVFKERAFSFVTQDYFDISLQFRRALQDYSALVDNSTETTRRLITFPLINMAQGRLECISRAYVYLNETQEGYFNGIPLVLYRATYNRHYDMSYVPKEILRTGLYRSYEYYDRIQLALSQLRDGLNMLIDIGENFALTGSFDETLYDDAENLIGKGSRTYNYRLYMYESRLVTRPLDEMTTIIQNFEILNRTLISNYEDYSRKNNELQNYIENFRNSHFHLLAEFNRQTVDYLSNDTYLKTDLSLLASSEEMQELSGFLNFFFSDLRDRMYGLQQDIMQLSLSYRDIWKAMVEEETTSTFYEQVYNDSISFLSSNSSDSTVDDAYLWTLFAYMLDMNEDVLRNYTKQEIVEFMNGDFYTLDIEQKLEEIERLIANLTDNLEASKIIQYNDERLRIVFAEIIDSLQRFTDHNKVDSSFYR